MIKLFEFLIAGCWHRWENYHNANVEDNDGVIVGAAVYCRCTKCGTPKRFNLY